MEKHIFISDDGTELQLPVTPSGYTIPGTRNTKVVDLAQGAELLFVGNERLGTITLDDVLLPRQQYPFAQPWVPQDRCRAWLEKQLNEKRTLRYVITERNFSFACKLITAEFSERDGSGDLYVTLVLHKYVPPAAATDITKAAPAAATPVREDPPPAKVETTQYTIKPGDNLWSLCQKHYSNGNLYKALAAYNGIKNPSLVFDGQIIKLPPKAELEG